MECKICKKECMENELHDGICWECSKKDEKSMEGNKDSKHEKTILKMCSKFIIGLILLIFILSIIINLNMSSLLENNNTSDIGIITTFFVTFLVRMLIIKILFLLFPLLIASICGLKYYSKKSNGKLTSCWIWGSISFCSVIRIMYIFKNGMISSSPYYRFIILLSMLSLATIVLYLYGCYKESKRYKIYKR